ncbi:sulfotransferase family protein, partial [Flavobacteriales bacterium]|nr:sulfotransferase family protein [Flavobacteriales bacterium]
EDTFNSLYKFCFVRNPYKRLFSAYTFLKEGGINNQDLEFSKSYLKEYINFNEFVLKGLERKEIMNWVHFKPQYTFICDENDKVVMDFIGKVENLKTDFNTVCKHLNIKSELQTLNKSKIIKNEFSEEIKTIIKLKYQKDFNLFYPDL